MELATEDHTEKAASILEALYAHPMLRELEVEVDSSYPIFCIDALVGFIRSTSCLEKLSLICFIFSSEETVDMIDALQRNQSISKLTLAMCDVDAEKAEEFGTLMRSDRVSKGIAELTVSGSPRPALLETEESFVDVSRMLCANSFDVESLSVRFYIATHGCLACPASGLTRSLWIFFCPSLPMSTMISTKRCWIVFRHVFVSEV
jgi:hypothetical protein